VTRAAHFLFFATQAIVKIFPNSAVSLKIDHHSNPLPLLHSSRNSLIARLDFHTNRNLNKHLSRVQNAVRIEHFLDPFHHLERRAVDRVIEIRGLYIADAVFA
jgi:hypothetical protein